MDQSLYELPIANHDYPSRDLSSAFETSRPNRTTESDAPFHNWYNFVLSFPPHLVRHYLREFALAAGNIILDPFCGTGTTLVESRLNGVASVGIEANPFAHFASSVKTDWSVSPGELASAARTVAEKALKILRLQGIDDLAPDGHPTSPATLRGLSPDAERLLIDKSISPIPLHKALVLLDALEEIRHRAYYAHALLAFADALVYSYSNLRFGPEVGVGKPKQNAPVVQPWLDRVGRICSDLSSLDRGSLAPSIAHFADAREPSAVLDPHSVDAVVTSPPYPNEKDYTRTTRLESVVLGFISSREELRDFKKTLVRSNTRGVYKQDDDDRWVVGNPDIEALADAIERRRIELGKTSGFERLYARVTRLYFGGMARHLADLRGCLKRGASLAYVVGDQASYLRVMIPTGHILASIASSLGYQVLRVDLFRSRFSTATRTHLREEVVLLRWSS
jgi:hypothetical protein